MTSLGEKVDAVIVGAGAAGSLYAARLAEAGKGVLVLEAGPAWTTQDLVSSQIWARRLRWGGEPVTSGGAHPFAFGFNAGWGFGGAALHHYGTWPRMHEADFEMRSRYGKGLDWPISYADVQPYYDRFQREAGVSGDAELEVWRPPGAAYPLPPLAILDQARAIKTGFDALQLRTAPAPMAILSREYNGRSPCLYDGWCDAGCPIGALYNPLISDIPRAKAAGAEFRAHSTATRILLEGERAVGVEYADKNGERREARGDTVILAASVVHNSALLLNSVSDGHPEGAANSSGLVGKNFMTHAVAPIYGLFDEPTAPYLGVSGAQLLCQDAYEKERGATAPFGSYQWLIAPAMKPNDLLGVATTRADIFGQALHDFMARAADHIGNMVGFVEELPRLENKIELSEEQGRLGVQLPRIVHGFDEATLALRNLAREEGLAVFRAAGVDEPWSGPVGNAHMMGGAIMGSDPKSSVADSYGRSHDIENLVIAGASVFPTGAAVNPTFTIYALSLRSVEHMIENWSDYAS